MAGHISAAPARSRVISHLTRTHPKRRLSAAAQGTLPGLIVGVGVMLALSSPLILPLTNLAAALGGFVLLAIWGNSLSRLLANWPSRVAGTAVTLLALSMLFDSTDGVRRWVTLGSLQVHPSAVVLPAALLSIAALVHRERVGAAILWVGLIQAIHFIQPDAGQSTAFAAGIIAISATTRASGASRLGMASMSVAGATATWTRPDPLLVAPFVEDIVPKAFELGPVVGVTALVTLTAPPAIALLQRRGNPRAAVALAAYFVASVSVAFLGTFPTPLVGHGASPIVGTILGLGLCAEGDPRTTPK